MNFASWKHWATVLGLPALAAFLWSFQQSGDSFSKANLVQDAKLALAVFVAAVLGLIQPNAAQQKEIQQLNVKLVQALSKAVSLVFLVFLFRGCGASAAQVITDVSTGINTADCIINTVSTDVAAGDSWEQCVADATAKCSTDATTTASVWASHVNAEVREGFIPKMPVPNTDGGNGQ